MRNFYQILASICMICTGCDDKTVKTEASTPSVKYFEKYNDDKKLKELSEKIITQGDTISFNEMADIYMITGHQKEFLYYSMRISNDYNYHGGYYMTYLILHTDVENGSNKKINKLANYNLLKAYELGNKNAKRNIKSRFEKIKIPKSEEYWDQIQ